MGLVLAAAAAFSGARHDRCESTVADRLAELNITDVAGIAYVAERGGAGRASKGRVVGVKAWVSLESCKGSVVMGTNHRRRINRIWTRG